MWKKDEGSAHAPEAHLDTTQPSERMAPPAPKADRATIGRSITVRGEVTGDEDLLIQGRVEGSVDLKQHAVTVGPDGEVKASITARIVTVEGKVDGNVSAEEQVILRSSGRLQGDILAPRLVLEDGARFRGGVDMGEAVKRDGKRSPGSNARSSKPSEKDKQGPILVASSPGKPQLEATAEVAT